MVDLHVIVGEGFEEAEGLISIVVCDEEEEDECENGFAQGSHDPLLRFDLGRIMWVGEGGAIRFLRVRAHLPRRCGTCLISP